MQNQLIDELTITSKKSYETMKSLGDINSSAIRKLTDLQFDFIGSSIESSIKKTNLLNSKDNIEDVFVTNSEFVNEYNESLIGFARKTVEIFNESHDEVAKIIEKTMVSEAVPAKEMAKRTSGKTTAKKTV